MHSDPLNRRDFLAAAGALGAVWLVGGLTEARDAGVSPHVGHGTAQAPAQQLRFLTPDEAADIEAMAARIIPSDDTPGAREAGVIWFIDRGLATFARDQQQLVREGVKTLAGHVRQQVGASRRFAALTPAQQDEVLRRIEETPFFGAVRFATIAGMFALPSYGGNRGFAGWRLMGQDTVLDFRPPFGWYDEPANRRRILGEAGR